MFEKYMVADVFTDEIQHSKAEQVKLNKKDLDFKIKVSEHKIFN